MKRRWFLYALGGAAALVAGAAVTLKVFLPPAKVKELALKRIAAALGREVRLASADVSFGGVRLAGLEVSEVPDFKSGKALKARSVSASPRWWILLTRREAQVSALTLDGVEVWASPSSRPAAAPSGAPKTEAAAAGATALSVDRLTLKDGSVHWKDPKGLSADLAGLALDAQGVRLDGPFPLSLSFDFKTAPERHAGRVELQGTLDPAAGDLAKASVTLEPLAVTVDGVKARAAGKVARLSAPRVEVELTLPPVGPEVLPALKKAPPGFSLPALSGPLKLSVGEKGVSLETLELKGDGAKLAARAEQAGTRWKLSSLSAVWGAVSLAAEGSYDSGAKGGPAADLKARLSPMPLGEAARLVPGATAYEASGTLSGEVAVRGPVASPALSGALSLEKAAALVSGQRLSDLDAKLDATPDSAAGTLRGKLNAVPFAAKLDARDLRKVPQVRLDLTLERLDLAGTREKERAPAGGRSGTAAKPAKPEPPRGPSGKPFRLQGAVVAKAVHHPNFEAGESKVVVDLRSAGGKDPLLDGTLSLRVGPGRFEDLRLVAGANPVVQALLLPVLVLQKAAAFIKLPFFPRFDTFKFSEIRGDYALKDGVLTIRESKLDGELADAELSGTADLVKDSLDIRAKVRIGGQGALKLGGVVTFRATGPIESPSVALDPVSILKQPAVEKAVDQTLKQGAELLKGLFK